MLLAIDIGNTNIVFAAYDGDTQVKQWRVETNKFNSVNAAGITDVIVCSVVPGVNERLIMACEKQYGVTPVFITKDNIDIDIDIQNPEQMGADRLVVASAAWVHYQSPAIVVDCGTATTFDVLNESGAHCGGVIAPGPNLSIKALELAAAQLPDIKIIQPDRVIGKNTIDAMQSGVYWGYVSLIEGLIKRIRVEAGNNPMIIATGGLSSLFEQGTDIFDVVDQDLIMKGLVHLHKVLKK